MGLRDVILAPDSSRHKIFFGGKGWVRCSRRIAALPCHSSSGSSRHEISWKICRFSAVRPEPRSTQEPHGLAPFSRLFRFTASADRQMTPALFVPLFRACALSRHSLADWLFALPAVALIPCAQHCAGLRAGVVGRWTMPCLSRRGAVGRSSA